MTERIFRSWIPTVTGNLSFSAIGQTFWPRRCLSLNRIERESIGLFLQRRYLLDVVFPIPIFGSEDRVKDYFFRLTASLSGKFFFACYINEILEKDGDKFALEGVVFPFLGIGEGKDAAKKVRKCIRKWIPHTSGAKEDIEATVNRVKGSSPLVCHFQLNRNGLIKIWFDDSDIQEIKDLEALNQKDINYLVEQTFFFLRDIVHNHQHHDAANDTVVRLHREGSDWKQQVYYDLFRKVISFKRKRTEKQIINALGIIAYAESFKKIVADDVNLTEFNVEEIEKSLESARFELSHRTQSAIKFYDSLHALIFGVSGLAVSIILLMNLASDEQKQSVAVSNVIVFFAQMFTANPVKSLVAIVCFCYAFLILRGNIRVEYWHIIEDFQRLFQHLKQVPAGITFGAIGLFLYFISWLFSLILNILP